MNLRPLIVALAAALGCAVSIAPASAQSGGRSGDAGRPCSGVSVDAPTQVLLGKSTIVRLNSPTRRVVVGGSNAGGRAGRPLDMEEGQPGGPSAANPALRSVQPDGIADVDLILLSPTELFFVGKRAGSMNVVLQGNDGHCTIKNLVVTLDPTTLQSKLAEVMPEETGIKIAAAENSLVLSGIVSSGVMLDQVMNVAASYGDGKKIVNLLRVTAPQQVMLEVTVAEVGKTLLDRLGAGVFLNRGSAASTTYAIVSEFLANGGGLLRALRGGGRTIVDIDGQKDDGLVRVLAEPNIMAISGQRASFLSGGKVFIPVAQTQTGGLPTITLEEKEFGIGVRFTPTVLHGSRISLKLVTEVSDLTRTGSPFTAVNGVTSVLPSFTVRRADTTVELNDGQSLVVAGLINNSVSETVKRFPGLGEIPIIGALFRSTEFQKSQSELLFVITPRLVKPLAEPPRLPTANHVEPSRAEVFLNGALEAGDPAIEKP